MKIGSHVGMSGKEMLLGSAKEAVSYGRIHLCFIRERLKIRGGKKSKN